MLLHTLVNPLWCYEKNRISPFRCVLCHCLRMVSIRRHCWCWVRTKKQLNEWVMCWEKTKKWQVGDKDLGNWYVLYILRVLDEHSPGSFSSPLQNCTFEPSNFPLHHCYLSLTCHNPCADSMPRLWQGVYTLQTVSTCQQNSECVLPHDQ